MLAEADYAQTELAMQGAAGRHNGDEFLLVKFFMHPRIHPAKSAAAERPIYVDTPYVSIMQPGNKDSIIIRPATAMDKNRFAEHWRKYEARTADTDESVEGTRLEDWAGVTRAQCEELRYMNVRTVEQLAGMSDSNSQNIMGINVIKQRAEKYLDQAKESATTDALDAANKRIDELVALMEAGTPDAPKKRTRRTPAQMAEARGENVGSDKEGEIEA